ncbi:hypothetical protein SprV_0100347600 [Sparganum proliferum]
MSRNFAQNGVPAILVYKNKELIGNLISISKELDDSFSPEEFETFLYEHGFLPPKGSPLSPIQSSSVRRTSLDNFLADFDLVDCRQSRLHVKTTNLTVRGVASADASRQLAVLDPEPENPFRQLLAKYPALTRPNFSSFIPPHDFVHHIRTTGPHVFSRPRRLAHARLAAAKAEFEHMLQMSIIPQSESPWASPLHMVPNAATGDWRPCCDYRALNNALPSA